jgi:hypothetical protein
VTERRSTPADLFDTDVLADELGVPARTLQDWRYRRIGPPFVKVGALVRYRRADVDRWLAEQTVATGRTA